MAFGIAELVAGAIKPITDLIGDMHTSKEEKGAIQLALAQVQTAFAATALEYESKLLEQQASVVKAEAAGSSWLQQSWRPITMLTFVALVTANCLLRWSGMTELDLPPEMWTLIQLGLTGYVAGRSLEKIMPSVMSAVGNVTVGGKKKD